MKFKFGEASRVDGVVTLPIELEISFGETL
jgi:hypothetical protein